MYTYCKPIISVIEAKINKHKYQVILLKLIIRKAFFYFGYSFFYTI